MSGDFEARAAELDAMLDADVARLTASANPADRLSGHLLQSVVRPFETVIADHCKGLSMKAAITVATHYMSEMMVYMVADAVVNTGASKDRVAAAMLAALCRRFPDAVSDLDMTNPDLILIEDDGGEALAAALKGGRS